MPKGVGPGIAVFRRIGRGADSDTIEDENERAHSERPSQSDRVPGRFHLDRVENPIRILRDFIPPVRRLQRALHVTFHIMSAALFQGRGNFLVA